MKFPKLTKDLAIISNLGDNPGVDNGLSAQDLKEKFDEAALILQGYLNDTVIETLNDLFAGGDSIPSNGLNMNGAINMNMNPLQNVRDPQSDLEALNLRYAKNNFASKAYGLGSVAVNLSPVMNANNAYRNGWYLLDKEAENGVGYKAVMRVESYNSESLSQTVLSPNASTKHLLIQQRSCLDGEWSEWEWVDPPMLNGEEYRTTERMSGKAVYKKIENGIIKYRLDGEEEWHPYRDAIGAAPSGYGFGDRMTYVDMTSDAYSGMTFEAALETVLATMPGYSCAQVQFYDPNGDYHANKFVGKLWKYTANYVTLEAINYSGYKAIKRKAGGTWQPWEWENPPMSNGEEYRTTERWNGKVVYTKLVNLGTTVDKNSLSFDVPSIANLIRFVPNLDSKFCTDWDTYSTKDAGGATSSDNAFYCLANRSTDKVSVYAVCGSARVGKTLYAQAWYTKD